MFLIEPLADQVEIADHDPQQIVEVVREPTGQLADRLELLALVQLLLQHDMGADVPEGAGDLHGVAMAVAHQAQLVVHPDILAVLSPEPQAHAVRACAREPLEVDRRALLVLGVDAAVPKAAITEEVRRRPAQLLADIGADECQVEFRIGERVEDRRA